MLKTLEKLFEVAEIIVTPCKVKWLQIHRLKDKLILICGRTQKIKKLLPEPQKILSLYPFKMKGLKNH